MLAQRRQSSVDPHGQEDTLQLRVYTSWDDLAHLNAAWEHLLRNSTGASIFSTPEWLDAWWKAYGRKKQLVALAFACADGELVGLAPFYIETLPGGIKRLRLVGDGSRDSDSLDLIVRSGHEEACSNALLEWLASKPIWDLCELNTLPAASPNASPLLSGLRKRGWVHAVFERPNFAIDLPESWETYLAQLSKHEAHNIKYYSRRLHHRYAVRTLKCAKEEELPSYLGVLFELHQMGWNSRAAPGAFALPERRQFYADMSRDFLRRGWLEFWLLELDGKFAAARFDFRYGDAVYALQGGRDPAHNADRVGMILRAHIIHQVIAEGAHRYDFLGGADSYKQSWGAQSGAYRDIQFIARRWNRARLYMYLRNTLHLHDGADKAASWLRANVPSAFSLLWRLRNAYRGYQTGD